MSKRKQATTKTAGKVTPLMKQYFKVKSQHPDAILLFRVGDFYETFGEDAVKVSAILGIVLTSRNNGGSDIELAGFPYHSLDLYLPKIVKAGYRVAICEQLEKPSKEKKIVKRGVTDMVTPGIAIDDKLLDHRKNNYLASLHFSPRGQFGVAFVDISTGEFMVSEGDKEAVAKLFQSLEPAEILLSKEHKDRFEKLFGNSFYTFCLDEWVYTFDFCNEKLIDHFQTQSLKGFSIEELELGQVAAGAALQYLSDTRHDKLQHIRTIQRIHPDRHLWLDRFTIRNLELLEPSFATGKALIDIIDTTVSPMGSRMMRKWLLLPLKTPTQINTRLEIVQHFIDHPVTRDSLTSQVKVVGDLERLVSKISMARINPREMRQLLIALRAVTPTKETLMAAGLESLASFGSRLNPCAQLANTIARAVCEDPPANIAKGNVIMDGYHPELDELRFTMRNSKELLLDIQQTEASRTGIANLKIGYNNVFGYYLEVTNRYKDQGLVPENWVRKQTLTNSERYITDELKKLEQKILGAQEKIQELEENLYAKVVEEAGEYIAPIQINADVLAQVDCLLAFANNALKLDYVKPEIFDQPFIEIRGGRHPVIERNLPLGESYIPNDVLLDTEQQQIIIITGPNMSGKSAVLRQTALIVILAQVGSYVPAKSARLGALEKVFTRVGASDNISSGESTFMVEMNETASIMNNVNSRSLVLLDEIGRGTSTYDGISIAWSVAEYLHNNPHGRPMTLFATHYHELNDLEATHPRVHNFHISTKEVGNKVLFLRKLVKGGTEHSFGIHVAKMAGMPQWIVHRASEILVKLEQKGLDDPGARAALPSTPPADMQLSIFEHVDPAAGKIKEMLMDIEVNQMTPIDCMMKLLEMQNVLHEEI